jgi:isopenicillin-N N-acyltransferase-like protein
MKAKAAECTAIGRRLDDGRVWIAQNWDWKPQVRDTCVVLACAPHDRPGFVTLVEAGLWAKCGTNEAGIGLATNALQSSRDRGEPGIPYHAILRRILTSATFEDAAGAVLGGPRASSANYLIGHRDGRTVDLEVLPGGADDLFTDHGSSLVHANHFMWPSPRPFKDVGRIDGEDSLLRHACAARSVDTVASFEGLRAVLASHDDPQGSVCAHGDTSLDPVADYVTVASVIIDLHEGSMWVTDGNPCEAAYENVHVGDLVDMARASASV